MKGKKQKKPEWTEERLTRLLSKRCAGKAWAFLPQVRNGTGWKIPTRTIDAIAMSLYPSRGLHLYGFEVKTNRADWLTELRDPDKAEDIFQFCDFWYIVTPPGIVSTEELPKTWGLMEARKGELLTKVKAPLLAAKPVNKLFLASLLRKVTENMPADVALKAAHMEGVREGRERAKEYAAHDLRFSERELEALKKRVEAFEKLSGLEIDNYRPVEGLAKAVRTVLTGEDQVIIHRLERVRDELRELLKTCEQAIENEPRKSS